MKFNFDSPHLNKSRKDHEFELMQEVYEFCFVTGLTPEHVYSMTQKERSAAIQAWNTITKERNKG